MTTQYLGKPKKQHTHLTKGIIDPKTGESLVAKHKALLYIFKNQAEQIYHANQQASAMQLW